MSMDLILTQEKHMGLILLNRAHALNALTLPMVLDLIKQLQIWSKDDTIHAVVVLATDGKAFCAGGDVRWLYDAGKNKSRQQLEFFYHEYQLNQLIHDYPKPYIALMDGLTMGGGVGISLHGSHPVASERFVFAMPETAIGFFPDIGASYLLNRCPDHVGFYLGLTGNRLGAEDAYELGLIKHVVKAADMDKVLKELIAADLSFDAPKQVTACLQQFIKPVLPSSIAELRDMIATYFSAEDVESIIKGLTEKGSPWCLEIVNNLNSKSPLSLKITLQQLKWARERTLADCLALDYRLVQHFMQSHDFYEGVRAVLIDKDKSPRWWPKTLAEVSGEQVNQYFR